MNRAKKINEYLTERLGEEQQPYILFNLSEWGSGVKVEASDYDVLEFILNLPDIWLSMLKDMDIEDELQLRIVNKRLEFIHDHVEEIYKKFNNHD